MKIYGIKNCDTVKKAFKHLDTLGLDYEFIDLKKVQLSLSTLKNWLSQSPNVLINKKSTIYRQFKIKVDNTQDSALLELLQQNGQIFIGYDVAFYENLKRTS